MVVGEDAVAWEARVAIKSATAASQVGKDVENLMLSGRASFEARYARIGCAGQRWLRGGRCRLEW